MTRCHRWSTLQWQCEQRSLWEHIVAAIGCKVNVGKYYCTMSNGVIIVSLFAAITYNHIITTMNFVIIVAYVKVYEVAWRTLLEFHCTPKSIPLHSSCFSRCIPTLLSQGEDLTCISLRLTVYNKNRTYTYENVFQFKRTNLFISCFKVYEIYLTCRLTTFYSICTPGSELLLWKVSGERLQSSLRWLSPYNSRTFTLSNVKFMRTKNETAYTW
jgi:hypothetical protein